MNVTKSNVIAALTDIMDQKMHLEGISLALYNMSCWPDTRKQFVEEKGGALLVRLLADKDLTHIQKQMLTSISNIAASPASHVALLKSNFAGKNFVQSLNQPIQDSHARRKEPEFDAADFDETSNKIAMILMCLSTTEECCKQVSERSGGGGLRKTRVRATT